MAGYVEFDTRCLPAQERFDGWVEFGERQYLLTTTKSRYPDDFPAVMRSVVFDTLHVTRLVHPPLSMERTERLIRRSDPEVVMLVTPMLGGGGVATRDNSHALGGDRFVPISSSEPYEGWNGGGRRGELLMVGVQRTALRPFARPLSTLLSGPLDARHGIGVVLRRHVIAILDEAPRLTDVEFATLGATTLDLVLGLLAREADEAWPVSREAMLVQIDRYVRSCLADAGLGPARIAEAHHISVRQLHKLFEEREQTIAVWIRDLRLERCRQDLADPALRRRPVQAIGASWGLPDPAHFGKAFRAAYGLPPGEYRRTVLH